MKTCSINLIGVAACVQGIDSVIGDARMTGVHDKFIALNAAGNSLLTYFRRK